MLERLRRSLARLGRNVINGIWRLGSMARFFGLVIASSGTSFQRFRLVMRFMLGPTERKDKQT